MLPAPVRVPRAAPAPQDVTRAAELLKQAERPLIIAGGGLDSDTGRRALAALAHAHGVPVALTFKHQEIFDNASSLYAGHLGFKIPAPLVKTLQKADLILAIGTRMGDTPSQGYRLPRAPKPDQPFVHVWPDPDVLGQVFETDLPIAADPALFCDALSVLPAETPPTRADWAAEVNGMARKIAAFDPADQHDGLNFGAVAAALAEQAPHDTIVTTDSGNFSGWVHLTWPWDGTQQAIGSVGGAMGLGVPGAVAAALRNPDKTVLGFVGDGGLLMTGNELAAAMAKGAKPKIVVSDNGTYGTIRLHQERDHPNRVSGTNLVNPDFAAWAEAFGIRGFTIARGDDIAAKVSDFLAHDGPALLAVRSSAEAISAYITISGLHARMTRN
jgi:acetolactate synthase-1/2/3 large subunit